MNLKTYRVGGLCIRIASEEPIEDSDYFPLFRVGDDAVPDISVSVLRRQLPEDGGAEAYRTDHRRRVVRGGKPYEYTSFSDTQRPTQTPYACAFRQGARVMLYVDYDSPFWDTMIFDALDLPDLFLERSCVILHSSFIGHNGRGLLFAGQKQQGKSTQAALWEKFAGALVINGDRAVVRETENGFVSFGFPFCGTSRICLNEQRPLRAVVFPAKGSENLIEPLSGIEAFKLLIGCVSYTREDPAALERAVSLTERIAAGVPCYRLTCRPDRGAVETLAREISAAVGEEQ